MEWSMTVNDMLTTEITKLNHTLIPPGFRGGDVRTMRLLQDSLGRVIDQIGAMSSTAQGLNRCLTTAEKLRQSPGHSLYLLKDPLANDGKGEVVGLLKVGRKHLYLWDERARTRELEPLCVLDFYVLTERQRCGLGRILFDHMLKDQDVTPVQLAIDGPSKKIEKFLAKNYGLDRLIHQSNNFSVSPNIFAENDKSSASGRNSPVAEAASTASAVGRFAAHQPASSIASVIHGGGQQFENSHQRRARQLRN